jgi:hypothetical protein
MQCFYTPSRHSPKGYYTSSQGCNTAYLVVLLLLPACVPALNCSKLFQDDPAVKSGMLQVFVRMKPVPDTMATCMQLEQNQLLKAVWYVCGSCTRSAQVPPLANCTAAVMAAAAVPCYVMAACQRSSPCSAL